MVSARLVHQIETHWETVAFRLARRIRECREVPTIARRPESELQQVCQRLLSNLGHYLVAGGEVDLAERYEEVGRQRYRDHIPLHEAVRALQIMKEETEDYIRDQGFHQTSVELYAEEELEHHLGRFFDLLQFHMVKGYENAMSTRH